MIKDYSEHGACVKAIAYHSNRGDTCDERKKPEIKLTIFSRRVTLCFNASIFQVAAFMSCELDSGTSSMELHVLPKICTTLKINRKRNTNDETVI